MSSAAPLEQRRILTTLIVGQILGGLGFGATVSTGALLAVDVSGSEVWSGIAATASTLGAALAALPLARLAARRGRRWSLRLGAAVSGFGAVVVVAAAGAELFPPLLAGLVLVGVGQAVSLQSRFAATDLSAPGRRGRDLSIIVWATTVGSVGGPNLVEPARQLSRWLDVPALAGPFLFTIAAQIFVIVTYTVALRPDPLLTAVARAATDAAKPASSTTPPDPRLGRYAIAVLAFSHATMVAVMAVTPVHLSQHGAELSLVGLTISLHIAGMYALSPVFGVLVDRVGALPVVLAGQLLFVAAIVVIVLAPGEQQAIVVALILLGLGWSASTVSAATLVARAGGGTRLQGRADLVMNLAGMLGGIAAGLLLTSLSYSGLAVVAAAVVAAAVISTLDEWRRSGRS